MRQLSRSMALLTILALGLSCAGPNPLSTLPSPPSLAELEPRTRTQYLEHRDAVEHLVETGAPTTELAQAVGALGQWFQAYEFQDEALAAYEAASRLSTSNPKWVFLAGHTRLRRGRRGEAAVFFERAVNLDPKNLASMVWLAETELVLGRIASAAAHFENAITLDPRCARALAGKAQIALDSQNDAAAIELLLEALKLEPSAASLHFGLATTFQRIGDTERARFHFDLVPSDNRDQIALSLEDPWLQEVAEKRFGMRTQQELGQRLLAQNRFNEAAEYFARAAKSNPLSIEAQLNLALALHSAGRKSEAEAAVRGAIAQNPGFARARMILANILLGQQRKQEALGELEKAVASDPAKKEAQFNLALLLRSMGRDEEAILHFSKACELDRRLVAACFGHASTLLRLGKTAEAKTALELNLRLQPEVQLLETLLARILAAAPESELRNGSTAWSLLRTLATDSPSVTDAESIAMVQAEIGDFPSAIAWQQAALQTIARLELAKRVTEERKNVSAKRLQRYSEHAPCREPWAQAETVITSIIQKPSSTDAL